MKPPLPVYCLRCIVTDAVEYVSPDRSAVESALESIPVDLRQYFELWEYTPLRFLDNLNGVQE